MWMGQFVQPELAVAADFGLVRHKRGRGDALRDVIGLWQVHDQIAVDVFVAVPVQRVEEEQDPICGVKVAQPEVRDFRTINLTDEMGWALLIIVISIAWPGQALGGHGQAAKKAETGLFGRRHDGFEKQDLAQIVPQCVPQGGNGHIVQHFLKAWGQGKTGAEDVFVCFERVVVLLFAALKGPGFA